MSDSLLLLAAFTTPPGPPPDLPGGYTLRPPAEGDTDALADLYYAAYPPGVAGEDIDQAREDIRATFSGGYGEHWPEASAVIEHHDPTSSADPTIAAAILVVRRAPWEGTPDCPFVVELFTDAAHRRRGLARAGLLHAFHTVAVAGAIGIALRVVPENSAAMALYRRLGFLPWAVPPPTS